MPWLEVPEPVWTGWTGLGLAVLGLLMAGGLWSFLRKRPLLPEPSPEPTREGPPRVFLKVPEPQGPVLLDPKQQESLVWGIGQFTSEEITRRLDLPATVRATAKAAGLTRLHFHRARYHREVWLWIDEAAADSTLRRLADEVEATLTAHGLPVERATFRGLPDRLMAGEEHVFAPREVDERRDAALVAVLTDGRALLRLAAGNAEPVRVRTLLRQLSHWPRLAFVDFSGGERLARLLERHEVETVAPHDLASFLGAATASIPKTPRSGEDPIWAAACALAPTSIDKTTAFELHRHLGLGSSIWALGPRGGERLRWTASERVRRVNWLQRMETAVASEDAALPETLDHALDFWEERYARQIEESEPETPAYDQLRMEAALVKLWRRPEEGTRELHDLFRGDLKETIQGHLGNVRVDGEESEGIALPWSWAALEATDRTMLREMGLGDDMPPENLRQPSRLWLGLGLCLGLAAGAVGWSATQAAPTDACQPVERTDLRNGMVFVRVCEGSFMMGSPDSEDGRWDDEGPVHEVRLSEFWIGKYEVTHEQYRKRVPDHKSYWSDRVNDRQLPVTDVSWYDAKAFCEELGFQLPTEAQWEYAARAGTSTPWSFGDDADDLGDYAWFDGNSDGQPQPVGTKDSNPWGLYDMHGNVWEWVADAWSVPYPADSQTDPLVIETGDPELDPSALVVVLRGGSFANSPRFLRSAGRFRDGPEVRDGFIGFRCVRIPRRQP